MKQQVRFLHVDGYEVVATISTPETNRQAISFRQISNLNINIPLPQRLNRLISAFHTLANKAYANQS